LANPRQHEIEKFRYPEKNSLDPGKTGGRSLFSEKASEEKVELASPASSPRGGEDRGGRKP
jgi:hypothetical protein